MTKLHLARLPAVVGLFIVAAMSLASANPAPDVLAKSTAEEVLAIVRQDKGIQAGLPRGSTIW